MRPLLATSYKSALMMTTALTPLTRRQNNRPTMTVTSPPLATGQIIVGD